MLDKAGCVKARLSVCALGLTFGVIKGLWLLLLAWAGWRFAYGSPMIEHIAHFYYGYGPSFLGGVIGGAWGFVSGFVFGAITAFIYNYFLCLCCKKCSPGEK